MRLSLLEDLVVVVVAAAPPREGLEQVGSWKMGDARFGESEGDVVAVHGGQPR
jgi:hypothetical protein